jgi:hypothetical protein
MCSVVLKPFERICTRVAIRFPGESKLQFKNDLSLTGFCRRVADEINQLLCSVGLKTAARFRNAFQFG